VIGTLVSDWTVLGNSLLVTLITTFQGLLLASPAVSGSPYCSISRAAEYSLYPFAVILQVTPVVAIARFY